MVGFYIHSSDKLRNVEEFDFSPISTIKIGDANIEFFAIKGRRKQISCWVS